MLANKASHKVKEQQGMVLAVVVIIFAVIMIMTATVVTVVYSDTKLSLDDENGKKAYYAARSAIEITERAILKNLGELQDTKGTIISNIKSEVDNLNESFTNGIPATEEEYEMELDAIIASYSSDIDAYKSQYIKFRNNVLPISASYTHKVTIDGFDTDSNVFDVIVTPLLNTDPDDDIIIDAFRLDTTAAVNGKKVSVSKWVGIEVKIGDDITIEKMEQATSSDNHIFDDAIYSYGKLKFGDAKGSGAIAKIEGTVTYEGELINAKGVNVTPYPKTPPTPIEDIPEPASLIPGGVTNLQERTNTLPKNILHM
jgi:Tfp pilus assembly protein PilX